VTGITNKWSPKTADDPQVIKCHQDCVQYKIEASSLLLRANELLKVSAGGFKPVAFMKTSYLRSLYSGKRLSEFVSQSCA